MADRRMLPNLGLTDHLSPGATSGWGDNLNQDLATIDALLFLEVISKGLSAPPDLATNGDRYLVAPGATGQWSGHDNAIAAYVAGVWRFSVPRAGWRAVNLEDGATYRYTGTQWSAVASSGGSGTGGGVTTVSGARNHGLAVTADGQTSFSLPAAVTDINSFILSVNGIEYTPGVVFTVSGSTLTWKNLYRLETADTLFATFV